MMLTDLADAARSAGLPVVELPGWRAAGHGPMNWPATIVLHHTAGPPAGDTPSLNVVTRGRPDLPGPLANLYLSRSGTVSVVAAGMAYHAGPVLLTSYGNAYSIGIEAEATGIDPWPETQLDAYARLVAALVRHYKLPPARVLGHKEICSPPGRKIDPNFDMSSFRARVARCLIAPAVRFSLIPECEDDMQIRVDKHGDFGEALLAEKGEGSWFADGLVIVGSTFGATRVWVTALGGDGRIWPLSAADGDLVANNTHRVYELPDGTRHATVEGAVEHGPNPDGSYGAGEDWRRHGTRPWAHFIGKR